MLKIKQFFHKHTHRNTRQNNTESHQRFMLRQLTIISEQQAVNATRINNNDNDNVNQNLNLPVLESAQNSSSSIPFFSDRSRSILEKEEGASLTKNSAEFSHTSPISPSCQEPESNFSKTSNETNETNQTESHGSSSHEEVWDECMQNIIESHQQPESQNTNFLFPLKIVASKQVSSANNSNSIPTYYLARANSPLKFTTGVEDIFSTQSTIIAPELHGSMYSTSQYSVAEVVDTLSVGKSSQLSASFTMRLSTEYKKNLQKKQEETNREYAKIMQAKKMQEKQSLVNKDKAENVTKDADTDTNYSDDVSSIDDADYQYSIGGLSEHSLDSDNCSNDFDSQYDLKEITELIKAEQELLTANTDKLEKILGEVNSHEKELGAFTEIDDDSDSDDTKNNTEKMIQKELHKARENQLITQIRMGEPRTHELKADIKQAGAGTRWFDNKWET